MKKLTLHFNTDFISLQYLPERLTINEATLTSTIPTLNGSASFIAAKQTIRTEYNIIARVFTTTKIDETQQYKESLASATAAGTVAVASQLINKRQFRDIKNVVLLARGAYDLTQRIILPFTNLNASVDRAPRELLADLRKHMKDGRSCTINWDLEEATDARDKNTRYLIKSINANALNMRDETLETIGYELDIKLVNEGDRVENG